MIDLLKNYKELHNSPGYVGSLRYFLAKKKLDTLFIKWLTSNKQTVEDLFKKAQSGKLKSSQHPNPLFSHHRVPTKPTADPNNLAHSQMPLANTITPPRNIQNTDRKSFNQTHRPDLARSQFFGKKTLHQQPIDLQKIPQFYFPNGKPLDKVQEASYKSQINTIFGQKYQISHQLVKQIVVEVIGIPSYFSILVMKKCANPTKMTKIQFNKMWKQLQNKEPKKRAFWLLLSDKDKKYVTIDDFKKLFAQILQVHPGLQFLKSTPQFQDWYSLCVINRIFFMANRKNDYKMTYRQFKKSRIIQSLDDIQNEPDINKNRDFYSYEDFYVIYIKFWQLDYDHDFFLTKQELSKYSGYTLSRKTIERIFSQCAKKFQQADKMNFGDFVWFILCVQDKTSEQSLQYWFKILDLDGNGIVTGYELQHFFQEQSQRLTYMSNSTEFVFENFVCQMSDLLTPKNQIQFCLQDFLKKKKQCGVFISMLTDLNKLVAYDERDAYQIRNQKVQNPDWTEWDNFVRPQYKRIESSADNDDGGQVLNWQNDQ